MREESARLRAAIDAIREAYIAQNTSLGATVDKTVAQKLDEIVAAQRKTETALATFSSVRVEEPPRPVHPAPPAPDPPELEVKRRCVVADVVADIEALAAARGGGGGGGRSGRWRQFTQFFG